MKLLLLIILTAVCLSGCVEREMIITSEPSGALVFVSDYEVGRTPVTKSFLWYGDYEIRVSHQGYETLNTHRVLRAPWYETIPLDLLSAAAPWTYHDRRYLHFKLSKPKIVTDEQLLGRAAEMRGKNNQIVNK